MKIRPLHDRLLVERLAEKEVKKGGTKIVKKVKTSHGVKKTVILKKGPKQDAAAKKGGFFQWLNGKNKKKS